MLKKVEYGKEFIKIKFNTDHNFPLNKPLMLHLLTRIVRCIFEEDGKFYLQLYVDDCLYEWGVQETLVASNIEMLEYDRIDISEGTDVNKTNVTNLSLLVF